MAKVAAVCETGVGEEGRAGIGTAFEAWLSGSIRQARPREESSGRESQGGFVVGRSSR